MGRSVLENRRVLDGLAVTLGGTDLATYRRTLRHELTGGDGGPVVATGHQPEFIHPGVWAKHVVAQRLASALGGRVLNLIVDSDVPKDATLRVPSLEEGELSVRTIRFVDVPAGTSYEDFPRLDRRAVRRLGLEVADAMGDRFGASLMPNFLDGFDRSPEPGDWVDQMVYARRLVEEPFGVRMIEHRVSRVWFGPLLGEMICNAHRFAACYNAALADYRRACRIRGVQRPIPDLVVDGPRCEVAAWVLAAGGTRRRLYVERVADTVRLFAGTREIGGWRADRLDCWGRVQECLRGLGEYRFRPRALTLTLWARLCLCDLFLHGIGGAKYDRITDRLIECYFGIRPPAMACVSATLLLDLPGRWVTDETVREVETRLRSLRCNPQRHLRCDGELAELAAVRAAAVDESRRLRAESRFNRPARRGAFETIREVSGRMLDRRPDVASAYRLDAERIRREFRTARIARRRDYFFALFRRADLADLVGQLPPAEAFGV